MPAVKTEPGASVARSDYYQGDSGQDNNQLTEYDESYDNYEDYDPGNDNAGYDVSVAAAQGIDSKGK